MTIMRARISLLHIDSRALTGHGLPAAAAHHPDIDVAISDFRRLPVDRTDQYLGEPDDRRVAERLDDELVEAGGVHLLLLSAARLSSLALSPRDPSP